jgi:predicted acylesterase/phospholipase RssA
MELFQMMMTYDLDDIMSFDLTHLPQKWGLVDNDKWKKYLTQMILLKWSYVPTLQQVFDQTGNILCITTWCMTQQPHAVYLTPQTHPDVLVTDAIAMSTNLPCIFTKMEYKGHLYIDGGIFDNCPTKKTESLLDREERLLVVRLSDYSVPYTIDSLTDYLKSILEIFHRSQTCPTPEQGDEIVLKPELGAMTLRVEKKVRTEIFQRVFKRIKYQLFIPKVKKE